MYGGRYLLKLRNCVRTALDTVQISTCLKSFLVTDGFNKPGTSTRIEDHRILLSGVYVTINLQVRASDVSVSRCHVNNAMSSSIWARRKHARSRSLSADNVCYS